MANKSKIKRCVSCKAAIPAGYWAKLEPGLWEAQCDCGCLNWLWQYKGNEPVTVDPEEKQ